MVYGFHPAKMWLTAGFLQQSAGDRLPFGLDRPDRGLLSRLAVPICGVAVVALDPVRWACTRAACRDGSSMTVRCALSQSPLPAHHKPCSGADRALGGTACARLRLNAAGVISRPPRFRRK